MGLDKYIKSFSKYNYGNYEEIKKIRIVLVYPGVSGESFFNSNKIGWEQTWHYPGFQCLSACLKVHNFSVGLIDFRNLTSWEDYEKRLKEINPDVVCFTSVSCVFDRVKEAAARAKKVNKEFITIVGGVHATIAKEEAVDNNDFEHIFIGEGDISVVEFMYKIEKQEKVERVIKGKIPNLDEVPFMDRELFLGAEDPGFAEIKLPYASIVTSRGCPFKCTFCQPSARMVFSDKVRQRSVDDVIDEMQILHDRGYKSIRIIDDLFIMNRVWLQRFIREYKNRNFNFQMICQCRADLICKFEDIIHELGEIGMYMMHIGLESGSDNGLKILKKGVTAEQNFRAVKICHEAGVKVFANYIFGIPGETREDMEETIRMLNETKPEYRAPNVLFPTIGSELYYECQKNGTLIEYGNNMNSNSSNVFDIGYIKGVDYALVKEFYYKSIQTENIEAGKLFERIRPFVTENPKKILIIHSVRNTIFDNIIGNISVIYPNAIIDIYIQIEENEYYKDYKKGKIHIFDGKYFDVKLIPNTKIDELNNIEYDLILVPIITYTTIGYKNIDEIVNKVKNKLRLYVDESGYPRKNY